MLGSGRSGSSTGFLSGKNAANQGSFKFNLALKKPLGADARDREDREATVIPPRATKQARASSTHQNFKIFNVMDDGEQPSEEIVRGGGTSLSRL